MNLRRNDRRGYAFGQKQLGNCFYSGVEQDFEEAVKWYWKSAEQGSVTAQNNLGDCLYAGKGVDKDYSKALESYRKAADLGSKEAKKKLDKLTKK